MNGTGYSGTPLLKKLGIKDGFRMFVLNAPANYSRLLGPLPPAAQFIPALKAPLDFIHFFTRDRAEYEKQLKDLKKAMAPNGMIWVSWPKAVSKLPTDVTESVVRGHGLQTGLVDIKVCAVDETWSGLKFVIPLEKRANRKKVKK